jgi:hypothetical protein
VSEPTAGIPDTIAVAASMYWHPLPHTAPEACRKASLVIADHALDALDCVTLLHMLGLIDER